MRAPLSSASCASVSDPAPHGDGELGTAPSLDVASGEQQASATVDTPGRWDRSWEIESSQELDPPVVDVDDSVVTVEPLDMDVPVPQPQATEGLKDFAARGVIANSTGWDGWVTSSEEEADPLAAGAAPSEQEPPAAEQQVAVASARMRQATAIRDWEVETSTSESQGAPMDSLRVDVPGGHGAAYCCEPSVIVAPTPLPMEIRVAVGTEIWFKPFLDATNEMRDSAGPPLKTFITKHMQVGSCGEMLALYLLGVPFNAVCISDPRQCSSDFAQRVFGDAIGYVLTMQEELAAGWGFYRKCGTEVRVQPVRVHCSTGKLPSYMRARVHSPNDERESPSSPYHAAVEALFEPLALRRPIVVGVGISA